LSRRAVRMEEWTLKQVQGDDFSSCLVPSCEKYPLFHSFRR
jgi:hypothetical protein